MKENLNVTLDSIIRWEGNDVNRGPTEPGGISKYGISLTAYSDYCKKFNLPVPTVDDVANLTEEFARNFYGQYWLPQIRFDELPNGVDFRLGDISINLGVVGAIRSLQLSLMQFPVDGKMSDHLIETLNMYDPKMVVFALSSSWISNKFTKPGWFNDGTGHAYGLGWSRRNQDVTIKSLGMIK